MCCYMLYSIRIAVLASLAHLGVNIHLRIIQRHILYDKVPSDLALLDNLLVQHRRGALGEDVALQLRDLLVGRQEVALQGRLVLGDDGDIHV